MQALVHNRNIDFLTYFQSSRASQICVKYSAILCLSTQKSWVSIIAENVAHQ